MLFFRRINICRTMSTIKQPPQLRRDKKQMAANVKKPQGASNIQMQILGTGANGAPAAVYLFTDQSRYLFNCGEGTQRLAHEHKTKLSRLEQIFVTRNTWTMMGGLPGLSLTVQDAGVRELGLFGPPHLNNILISMKRFVVLKTLQVNTKDCTEIQDFEDSVMQVKCVPLYQHNDVNSEQIVISYICRLKPRPGPLNLEKCVEYGVPPGPLLGQLKNGIDVTLENGTVVKSKDVSEPCEAALSFIFLDIPSEEYLDALQANTLQLQSGVQANVDEEQRQQEQLALIVHFSPPNVRQSNIYQTFIERFPTSTQHIYLNTPENTFSGFVAAHRIQYQLHQLHPQIFPLLMEDTGTTNTISNELKKTKLVEDELIMTQKDQQPLEEETSNDMRTVGLNSLTNFYFRPAKGIDRALEAKLNPSEYLREAQAVEGFTTLLQQLRENIKALESTAPLTVDSYPKITFLGTGSCIPNKTRNVSAILVQPHKKSYILLDCGEGTLGQIVRFFGVEQAKDVIRNLQSIYVSHLHADHHIGLIGLLIERQRLLAASGEDMAERPRKRLLLFAPKQIQPWLDFYNERIESISESYELIGNAELLKAPLDLSRTAEKDGRKIDGVQSIATCMVRHCPHSFGVSLCVNGSDREQPVKITYSGDTMPCQDLIELGNKSTILIHEATMEDDLIEEAKIKMHSTISQAITQGRAMQAEHIILTHFSQRYAKLPRMQSLAEDEATDEAASMHNVSIAFDNMQVTLEHLKQFHLLYPAMRALFAVHAEELEQKAMKRELKLERKRKLLNAN